MTKLRRWLIASTAIFIAVGAIGYVIRSSLLPERTVGVFLQHAEGASWLPAPRSQLFAGGRVEFAARDIHQLGGVNAGPWHEVVIASFPTTARYQEFLGQIEAQQGLARYHLLLLNPMAPEQRFLINLQLRRFRGDDSIDPGESVPVEAAVTDAKYAMRWKELFAGDYRGELVLLNFTTNRDVPRYPDDYQATDLTSEEAFDRYRERALRVLGKMGAQIVQAGGVEDVVIGPDYRRYESYGFAHYPSVEAFKVVFTAKERVDARIHQRAALDPELSAGYWVKPYPEL